MDLQAIAEGLIAADQHATTLEPISAIEPDFDSVAAYEVLDRISTMRRQQGWTPVGRKIGFTNRTIWELFGVDRAMWAHMWSETVRLTDGELVVPIDRFVQPRIEPEVVFKLRAPAPRTESPSEMLDAVEW